MDYTEKLLKKAKEIADYMVKVGTEETISGNYLFRFKEINEKFHVRLQKQIMLLDAIETAVFLYHGEKVAYFNCWGNFPNADYNCFDFIFYLNYCPNAEE